MARIDREYLRPLHCPNRLHKIVLTVHDEIVAVVPESRGQECLKVMIDIMRTPPAWAEGLPLDAEGDVAYSYGGAK